MAANPFLVNISDRPARPYDVYIGRHHRAGLGVFGNPFTIPRDGDRAEVIEKFTEYFHSRIATDRAFRRQVLALRGRVLGCFCTPLPCHGDVITTWLEENKP